MKRDLREQIKNLDSKELIARIKTIQVAIQDLVLDKNMDKLTDRKVIFKKRKELALLKTVLQQKELINKLEDVVISKKEEKEEDEKKARTGRSVRSSYKTVPDKSGSSKKQ